MIASTGRKSDRDSVSLESKWTATETKCYMANTVCAGSCMHLAKRRHWLLYFLHTQVLRLISKATMCSQKAVRHTPSLSFLVKKEE